MAWDRGKRLDGDRYEIEAVLGCGRFAITYKAWDLKRGRQPVAIKTLNDETRALAARDLQKYRKICQTVRDEAMQLKGCDHPNVVTVERLFEEEEVPWVVMEFVAGEDLSQCGHGVSVAEARIFVQQIGAALDHIHSKGILHRDVRPGNIRLQLREGKTTAVLMNFGSALAFSDDLSCSQSASHAGGFAAPEAYTKRGERGAWTDLYALGAVLYWLVTGHEPTKALDRRLATEPKKAELLFPSDLDRSVVRLIEWAMRLKGSDRPKSAALWLGQARNHNIRERWMNWSSLQKVGAVIGAMIAAAGGIGGAMQGWESWFGSPVKNTPPVEQVQGK